VITWTPRNSELRQYDEQQYWPDLFHNHTDVHNPESHFRRAGEYDSSGDVFSSAVLEPVTLSLVGGGRLGLGMLRRKKVVRQ
jgi:hypothetical protein